MTLHVIQHDAYVMLRKLKNDNTFAIPCVSYSSMPPWVASVPRLTFACRRTAIERSTCARRCRNVFNLRSSNLRLRSASTHVSPTAINYRPNIPPQNKELHDALSTLSGAAEQYVNLSRLQLALRGLEAENAVTRVAGIDTPVKYIWRAMG
jgi:hypothetical protein